MITFKKENTENISEKNIAYFPVGLIHGVIRLKNEIIGFYDMFWQNDNNIEIREFEILPEKRRKGYGREFIAALFYRYPQLKKITGLSMEESLEFYADIGAYFKDSCSSCTITECSRNFNSIKEDYYEDDICGDYSDNFFIIERSNFFKIINQHKDAV